LEKTGLEKDQDMSDSTILSVTIPTTETTPKDLTSLTREGGPFSTDPRLIVQCCLLIIATLIVAYLAADILLPIILAVVLKLLLQPAMRVLEKIKLPRTFAALILILVLLCIVIALGAAVSGPATDWAGRLPQALPHLEQRLQFLSRPIQTAQALLHRLDGNQANDPGLGLTAMLFSGTQHLAGGLFETLLVLFFLLVSGDTFLRRMVEVVPRFSDKRQVVALSKQIESNVSAYLVTITGMNLLVGIATGCVMWATGLGDPVFWGVVAFVLNYVPILGPFAGVVMFAVAGLLTRDGFGAALLPAGLYLLIHLIEGEFVTPILLARRFTLNPVVVIISLIFWFWMWGVPGAILAVPMLAMFKIICDGVLPLNSLGHFLEG
jgi:predicted PurR-regulated permease PerM